MYNKEDLKVKLQHYSKRSDAEISGFVDIIMKSLKERLYEEKIYGVPSLANKNLEDVVIKNTCMTIDLLEPVETKYDIDKMVEDYEDYYINIINLTRFSNMKYDNSEKQGGLAMTNHELRELVIKKVREKYGETRVIPLRKMSELYDIVNDILEKNDWYTGDPIKASQLITIVNEISIQSGGEGDDQFNLYLDTFEKMFRPEKLPIVYIGFECPDYIKRVMLEEKELQIKYDKLDAFLTSDKAKNISPEELSYMEDQKAHMNQYLVSLQGRINIYRKKSSEPIESFNKEDFLNGLEDIKALIDKNVTDVKISLMNSGYINNYTVKIDNVIRALSVKSVMYLAAIEKAIKDMTE